MKSQFKSRTQARGAAQGFTLIGGRLDEIGGETAAAIVYRRRQHIICSVLYQRINLNGETSAGNGVAAAGDYQLVAALLQRALFRIMSLRSRTPA